MFKNGDIITYENCPETVAIFKTINRKPNDSGDTTFKCHIALIKDELYFGNLVLSEDIRLATENEKLNFFENLRKSSVTIKEELLKLRFKNNTLL